MPMWVNFGCSLTYKGKQLEGASGLQVGVIQIIDLILGLSYQSKIGKATLSSRAYMPKHHQMFLVNLEKDCRLFNELVTNTYNQEIRDSYNRCVDVLGRYRRAHMQIGKIFIKGDGSDKKITTTGLSMNLEKNPVEEFASDMQERIEETKIKSLPKAFVD